MTYNTLPLLILEISNGNFTVKTQCETRRIKYIIFDVKKLSNFPDKGDQLFWNWIVSKLFFNNFLFNSVSRKHNGENSNLTFSFPYGVSTSRARAHTHAYSLQFLHRNRARDPFHRYAFLPPLSLFTFLPLFSLFFVPQHPSPSYFLYSYDSLSPILLSNHLAIFPRSLLHRRILLLGINKSSSTEF